MVVQPGGRLTSHTLLAHFRVSAILPSRINGNRFLDLPRDQRQPMNLIHRLLKHQRGCRVFAVIALTTDSKSMHALAQSPGRIAQNLVAQPGRFAKQTMHPHRRVLAACALESHQLIDQAAIRSNQLPHHCRTVQTQCFVVAGILIPLADDADQAVHLHHHALQRLARRGHRDGRTYAHRQGLAQQLKRR